MTDPIDLLTDKIKEIYISKNIFDLKEQMEIIDKCESEIINYLDIKFQISMFNVKTLKDLLNFYINTTDNYQSCVIYFLNEFAMDNIHKYTLLGQNIINQLIEDLEELDEDFKIDEVELYNTLQEDVYLDQEWDIYINEQIDSDGDVEMN